MVVTGRYLEKMEGGIIPVNIGSVAEVRLEKLLGVGGFGSAWKVIDTITETPYVLKIIEGLIPGSVEVERVRLEASVSIPSEHIVEVIGLSEWSPGTYLILFKYYEAKSLDKLLEERSLNSEQKKAIFKQVLMGVADAHQNNIVHRDLKPANILVENSGNVRLIDFGISKFKGSGLTVSGAIIGTLPYIAPELIIIGAKVADARADIYSLGHILYELAMGQHFWQRKGWCELKDLISYCTRTPAPTEIIEIDDFTCDFYRNAGEILIKMTKLDPEERLFSLDEVFNQFGYVRSLPEIPKDLHLRSPLLIVESGTNKGTRTLISINDGDSLILGRADLAGSDTSISREHLKFTRSGDSYFVSDLGSKNGTMIKGIALTKDSPPLEIKHTDRIKVGDIFLRFAFLKDVS